MKSFLMEAADVEYLYTLYITCIGEYCVIKAASMPVHGSSSAFYPPAMKLPAPSSLSIHPGGQYTKDSVFAQVVVQGYCSLGIQNNMVWLCYYWSSEYPPPT